ncbi:hypothetical protein HL658_18715 [Azospirillum sp. RWY-5-1]|uniref:Uncharacterized protein n=1 Tax=Azospirillum oleiclasticum TaxID=2735135 RepID=A0ABX2TMV0_9PROT|nr:hypothetical protein [Azospirillum oleiclasticum]NYZ14587.1 hypothetical protein [Azospirillum oleiclasticum]NYZ24365.1 hypothetical protein [Azospirillum oleiclasticum]
MTELRHTPIPRALHSPDLLLSGEGTRVMVTALAACGLGLTNQDLVAVGVALAV